MIVISIFAYEFWVLYCVCHILSFLGFFGCLPCILFRLPCIINYFLSFYYKCDIPFFIKLHPRSYLNIHLSFLPSFVSLVFGHTFFLFFIHISNSFEIHILKTFLSVHVYFFLHFEFMSWKRFVVVHVCLLMIFIALHLIFFFVVVHCLFATDFHYIASLKKLLFSMFVCHWFSLHCIFNFPFVAVHVFFVTDFHHIASLKKILLHPGTNEIQVSIIERISVLWGSHFSLLFLLSVSYIGSVLFHSIVWVQFWL